MIYAVVSIVKIKSSKEKSKLVYQLMMEIIACIIQGYILMCINSVHKKFRGEKVGRGFVATY
jgi:hypothetical protein